MLPLPNPSAEMAGSSWAAALDLKERQGMRSESLSPPIRLLRKAAAGVREFLAFEGMDPDYGVRRMFFGSSLRATSTGRRRSFCIPPIH